ncbi:hypothetical protein D8I24_2566 [Cupriavidus necator H850]|nr:hypothetical protein D8I24_2566 [Cupriavidus necator H850]
MGRLAGLRLGRKIFRLVHGLNSGEGCANWLGVPERGPRAFSFSLFLHPNRKPAGRKMGTKLSAGRSGVHERDAPHNDCGWSNYMGIAFVSQNF